MSLTRFAVSFLLTSMAYLSPAIAAEALPAEVKQGSVRYVTGGIGADAVEAFKQAAAKYPLELLFAQKALPNDVYLAGVKVTVRQAGKGSAFIALGIRSTCRNCATPLLSPMPLSARPSQRERVSVLLRSNRP